MLTWHRHAEGGYWMAIHPQQHNVMFLVANPVARGMGYYRKFGEDRYFVWVGNSGWVPRHQPGLDALPLDEQKRLVEVLWLLEQPQ